MLFILKPANIYTKERVSSKNLSKYVPAECTSTCEIAVLLLCCIKNGNHKNIFPDSILIMLIGKPYFGIET